MNWMEIMLILLFFLVATFAVFEVKQRCLHIVLYAYVIIALIIFTIFRDMYKSNDYMTYVNFFNYLDIYEHKIEFSFIFISRLIKSITDNYIWLFVFYALVSLLLKGYVLNTLSIYPFISLLAYIAYEFPNQELTAMRMGVAVAFLLLSIKSLYDSKYVTFFAHGLIAASFHYSAMSFILLPVFKLINSRNKQLLVFFISMLIPFFIYPFVQTVFFYIPENNYLSMKIIQYTSKELSILNAFRFATIYRYIIFLSLVFIFNKAKERNKYFAIEMSMFLYGIFLNSVFFFNAIFSYRLSALFYSVEILLFPNIVYIFKSKIAAKCIIVFFLGLELFYLLYGVRLFQS
jgi:hypothetical protein